jgi:hypothetical protein
MFLEQLTQESDRTLAPPGLSLGEIAGMGGLGVVYAVGEDQVMKIVHPRLTTFAEAEAQLKYEAEIEMALNGCLYF